MKIVSSQASPLYTKLAMVLVSLIALGYLSVLGKEVLSPLLFALLFSILLLPLANFFEKKLKLHRGASAGLSVLVLICSVGLILYLVGMQITDLAADWPQFMHQLTTTMLSFQHWISLKFHVNMVKQMAYVNTATSGLLSASTTFYRSHCTIAFRYFIVSCFYYI